MIDPLRALMAADWSNQLGRPAPSVYILCYRLVSPEGAARLWRVRRHSAS